MSERRRLLLVVLAAFAARIVLLALRGDYIVYDEGYYLLLARSLRAGHGFTLNGLPHVALSPLQPVLVAALSLLGIGDFAASRLLAAACGAALVVPVASLAHRWFGPRGAFAAALLTAVFPSLVAFLPFFPGERWNLYFGSEPLFLVLGVSAIALGARAADGGRWVDWAGAGLLGGLAYCARLEGIVLAAALAAAGVLAIALRRRATLLPRAALALVVGALVALPYLLYLHRTLGRWALSGRVQAAVTEDAPAARGAADTTTPARGGSDAVRAFVWGGDRQALWTTLYALDASGTRMASQYWGVPRPAPRSAGVPGRAIPGTDSTARAAPTAGGDKVGGVATGPMRTLARGIGIVVPVWILLVALGGAARAVPRADAALWLAPAIVTAVVPALLAYTEPRALLILAPVACILAGGAAAWLGDVLERRTHRAGVRALALAALAALLALPTVRDFARSWNQDTPLQQVATARRAVGEYLGAHLERDARVVSWHPAIALFARRDWRVLPYDSFVRIVGYARAQEAAIVVLSRFEPSPLRNPPRPFTAVLLDPAAAVFGDSVRLDPVDQTPVLFVGRLARAP